MAKKIGIVLFGGLALLLIAAALFLPSEVTVARSAKIQARPATVFGHIADLKAWSAWSPWQGKDANMKMTYSQDPATGVGASASWQSESQGNGSMTIVKVEPDKQLVIDLDFGGHGTATATFDLVPEGDAATTVTWTMVSHMGSNPIAKMFGQAMDSMVGPDFEQGLVQLKELSEKSKDEAVVPATPPTP